MENQLTFIRQTIYGTGAKALYQCSCGKVKEILIYSFKTNHTKSCKCRRSVVSIMKAVTHGMKKHPLYNTWSHMISRCFDPKNKSYKFYGERGVTVCDEWRHDPIAFIKWGMDNGYKKGLTLDKDINGPGLLYSPNTCRFVTHKENCNNTRRCRKISFKGQQKTLSEWSEILGFNRGVLSSRLNSGWDIEKALTVLCKQKI